jgi:hypothetical protein
MSPVPPTPDTAASSASVRTAWWVFGPPFVVVALHRWLQTRTEAWPPLHALKAVEVMNSTGNADALAQLWKTTGWPLLFLTLAVVAVVLSRHRLRRLGAAGLRRWLLPLWVLLCGVGAAGLLANHLNLAWRQPLPDVQATVLQARLQMPSQRGPGGLQLVLAWSGVDAPRRGLLEGENLRTLLPGRTVTVQRVRGAWWGEYLSGIPESGQPGDAQSR